MDEIFIYKTDTSISTQTNHLKYVKWGSADPSAQPYLCRGVFKINNKNVTLDNSRENSGFLKYIKPINYHEIDILKQAGQINQHIIVNMIGLKIEERINMGTLLLECAPYDMFQFFFKDGVLCIPKTCKSHEYVARQFEYFLTECLNFLHTRNYVYCDWKFDNILVFLNGADPVFKLTDFGSCQIQNVKIKNPYNINIMYSSPNLNPIDDNIKPTYKDDYKSISYLLYVFCGGDLPWSFKIDNLANQPEFMIKYMIFEILFIKRAIEIYKPPTHNLVYWPTNSQIFSYIHRQV